MAAFGCKEVSVLTVVPDETSDHTRARSRGLQGPARHLLCALIAVATAWTGGCAGSPGATAVPELREALPVTPSAQLQGRLSQPSPGCWLLDDALALWPPGTSERGAELHLPDGRKLKAGEMFAGGGGEIPTSEITRLASVPKLDKDACRYDRAVIVNPLE